MKKKALWPLLLSLLLAISLVGCSSSAQDSASQKSSTAQTEKTAAAKAKTTGAEQAKNTASKAGSNGAAPALKNGAGPGAVAGTRIMGQIISVKERTVTLALFDMPSAPGAPSGSTTKPSDPASGATPPAGGNQAGGPSPQLSGEKKTITIPAAVKIYSGRRDSTSEVSISSLQAGQMMEVRLNSSTGAVEEVRVMEAGQGGPPPGGNDPGQLDNAPAN